MFLTAGRCETPAIVSVHRSVTCLDRKAPQEGGEASAQARLPTGKDPWGKKTYSSSRGEAQIKKKAGIKDKV